ncbi:hypothetical protein C8F04DRAFT_898490, partial [Mycena alexandri]
DGIDRTEWSTTLTAAHAYLTTKGWGLLWTGIVDALVKFEWSHYHMEECGRLPTGTRPEEFAQWMKEHRIYGDFRLGAGFGERLLAWWKDLGPDERWDGVDAETLPHAFRQLEAWPSHRWVRLDASGRSGMVLLVLGLAWWGQGLWNE